MPPKVLSNIPFSDLAAATLLIRDQPVPLSAKELWEGLHPYGFREGWFMILRGYMDESYRSDNESDVFALSILLSTGENWFWLEDDWKKCIDRKNAWLRIQGRKEISRYHATDCSSLKKEFFGWSVEEQIDFSKELLEIFRKHEVLTYAYTVPLDEIRRALPSVDQMELAYYFLLKFVMLEIGDALFKPNPRLRLSIIHDRCDYDTTLLHSFNSMLKDQTFPYARNFLGITPMGWEDCILLQPADLMAYETFKDSERISAEKPRPRRKSLEVLISSGALGGRSRRIGRKALLDIAKELRTVSRIRPVTPTH